MNDPVLLVRVTQEEDGRARVLAPAVGWWTSLPEPGTLLGPGSGVGRLEQLNQRFRLVMPDGAAGRIHDGLPGRHAVAVEYGQTLFRLAPVGLGAADGLDRRTGRVVGESGRDALHHP